MATTTKKGEDFAYKIEIKPVEFIPVYARALT
jgi:hypothetical protein